MGRGIDFWYSRDDDGTIDKVKWLDKLVLAYQATLLVYVGDDLFDIPIMNAVKLAGGKTYCPFGAVPQVQAIVDGILRKNGGDGAIMSLYRLYQTTDTPPKH